MNRFCKHCRKRVTIVQTMAGQVWTHPLGDGLYGGYVYWCAGFTFMAEPVDEGVFVGMDERRKKP